jgi:cytochrome c-type biogenesis protein CcmH/NrfF
MKRRWVLVLAVLAVILTLILVACGGAGQGETAPDSGEQGQAPAALDGKALTEERCTKCHDLKRVESAKKTREEWKATVERMVNQGAELDEAEQQAVIDYLSETYPN